MEHVDMIIDQIPVTINTIDDFLKFQNNSLPWVYSCRVAPYQANSPNIKSLERCLHLTIVGQIIKVLNYRSHFEAAQIYNI